MRTSYHRQPKLNNREPLNCKDLYGNTTDFFVNKVNLTRFYLYSLSFTSFSSRFEAISASITFARKIFFRVSSLLKFRKMRGHNGMDTLNVRTARWVTKVPWHGWSVASCPQANRFMLPHDYFNSFNFYRNGGLPRNKNAAPSTLVPG